MAEGTYAWLVEMGRRANRYALKEGEFSIGRGTTCAIRLSDPKVSRSHARLTIGSGQVLIKDLNSSHGVFVNDQKVEEALINDGDRVQMGDTVFILEVVQDAIGTIVAPPAGQQLGGEPCRYCGGPIVEGEVYCTTCGSLTRELPEPFGFVQQAYLQLRALHRVGKMDATTFRAELEKMVISDGSSGYWMVGVQSGRWHWFNGSEWVQRDPPATHLKQAPLPDPQTPPPPPPAAPPPEPRVEQVAEGQRTRQLFLIGGGTLIAFSVLAIGAYAAYQFVNTDETPPAEEVALQASPISTISLPEPTQSMQDMVMDTPAIPPAVSPEPPLDITASLTYAVRPYNPETDETLSRLADFVSFLEAESSPEHARYEGTWYVQEPAIFSIGWCAIDEATLRQNLQVIQMGLEIDENLIEPESMLTEEFGDTDLACRSSRIVLEFIEPGEHRLRWTTTYSEPVYDGWETLEAGTYLNDYVIEVQAVTAIEDEFETSSGKWDEGVQGNFSLWTENGSFHIQVHKENFTAWSLYHDLAISEALILTHARRVSEVTGAYGLAFRYQDVSNFYYFLVDDTGYFTLGKRLAGEPIDLMGWTASEAILSGDDLNRLGVTATGNELIAFINSQAVATVTDDSFSQGSVGLLAQSAQEAGEMHAAFDVFYLESYD